MTLHQLGISTDRKTGILPVSIFSVSFDVNEFVGKEHRDRQDACPTVMENLLALSEMLLRANSIPRNG